MMGWHKKGLNEEWKTFCCSVLFCFALSRWLIRFRGPPKIAFRWLKTHLHHSVFHRRIIAFIYTLYIIRNTYVSKKLVNSFQKQSVFVCLTFWHSAVNLELKHVYKFCADAINKIQNQQREKRKNKKIKQFLFIITR